MTTESQTTLHYIYDPFCGWCYGLAPLLTEATAFDDLRIVAHGGGMLANERATKMSPDWRNFVRPHEARITALSGQQFSPEYQQVAQYNYDLELDSGPPTAAMLAAEALSGAGIQMLKRLQTAYYVEGQPIADRAVITRLAAELGLDATGFASAYEQALQHLDEHFAQSAEMLAKVGGHGYPTLFIERDGKIEKLHLAQLLGKPERFRDLLRERLSSQPENQAATAIAQ